MSAPTVRFAEAARVLAEQARSAGLRTPGFRSPPRVVGFGRTVRRRADGSVVVAVAIRGRPWSAVLADMIEGIVVANDLAGADATRARDDLWLAVTPAADELAA